MKVAYDTEADALYLGIGTGEFAENKEVMPGVILDIGKEGRLLGVEILEASRRYSLKDLFHVEISMPAELAEAEAGMG